VLDLAKTVKDAVKKQGMLGWQYNTIGVSDAITMGGEGKHILSHAKTCSLPRFAVLIHA
jgi:dihydroxyacid dehydratase/phosphogluconate dehydratase